MSKRNIAIIGFAAVLFVAVGFLMIYKLGEKSGADDLKAQLLEQSVAEPLNQSAPSIASSLDDFAKCLTAGGAEVYKMFTCPHCQAAQEQFGESWKYIKSVECHPQAPDAQSKLCSEKQIRAVPTWFVKGQPHQGNLSLEELSGLSGCPLPKK